MECRISELKSPKNTQQLVLSPFVNDKVENVIYLSKMTLHGEYIRRAVARWLSGRASDLRSSSRGFEARPRRCCVTTLDKLKI